MTTRVGIALLVMLATLVACGAPPAPVAPTDVPIRGNSSREGTAERTEGGLTEHTTNPETTRAPTSWPSATDAALSSTDSGTIEAEPKPVATEVSQPELVEAPPTLSPKQEELAAAIDGYLAQRAAAGLFSGSVLVAQDGTLVLKSGYGLANQTQGIPNTPQTKYRIASLSKSFTAMAILLLQGQGRLDLGDLACTYLEACPDSWQGITIHHLLSHTSGVPDITRFPDFPQIKATPSPPQQTIDRIQQEPLDFEPGRGWQYSNSGYIVLGRIIERVAGRPYEEFLREQLLEPLRMTNTGYLQDTDDLAVGYRFPDVPAEDVDMSLPFASGGLYSTVEDFYRWDQELYAADVLPTELVELALSPQAAIPGPEEMSYGYGWVLGDLLGHRYQGHNGGIEGYSASISRFPEDRLTIIVLSNLQSVNPGQVGQEIGALVFASD